ncbi:MAG: hypothetical protein GY859_36260 [Desulfobacterales bacterium]|nr:hypothetical protein [Desulfobacterales bacterium]
MCQRIMIASALSRRPSVLIADEPTTAWTSRSRPRFRKMSQETGAAVILITHDMGIVADMADQVTVHFPGSPLLPQPQDPRGGKRGRAFIRA